MMEEQVAEAFPKRAIIQELDNLQQAIRQSLEKYAANLNEEIARVRGKVEKIEPVKSNGKVSSGKLRDLREMLTLLHATQSKAEKVRRKDIKKFDRVVGDLTMLSENW